MFYLSWKCHSYSNNNLWAQLVTEWVGKNISGKLVPGMSSLKTHKKYKIQITFNNIWKNDWDRSGFSRNRFDIWRKVILTSRNYVCNNEMSSVWRHLETSYWDSFSFLSFLNSSLNSIESSLRILIDINWRFSVQFRKLWI